MTAPRYMRQLRRLHRAIVALDLDYVRKHWPAPFQPSSERAFLLSVHKARSTLLIATPEQRAESEAWLYRNGSAPLGEQAKANGGNDA